MWQRERKKYRKSLVDEFDLGFEEAIANEAPALFGNAHVNPFEVDQGQHAGGPMGDGCSAVRPT
jgi:hypothetical protein